MIDNAEEFFALEDLDEQMDWLDERLPRTIEDAFDGDAAPDAKFLGAAGPLHWKHSALTAAKSTAAGRMMLARSDIGPGVLLLREAPFVAFPRPLSAASGLLCRGVDCLLLGRECGHCERIEEPKLTGLSQISVKFDDDDFAQLGLVLTAFVRKTPDFFLKHFDAFDCGEELKTACDDDDDGALAYARFFRLESHYEKCALTASGYTSKMWAVLATRLLRKAGWFDGVAEEDKLAWPRLSRLVLRAVLVQKFNSFALLTMLRAEESEEERPFDAIGSAIYLEV